MAEAMEICENEAITSIPESPLSSQEEENGMQSWKGAPFHELKKHAKLKCHWKNTKVFVQFNDWSKPHPQKRKDLWDNHHVRLPCSNFSEFPKNGRIVKRWNLVRQALNQPILESQALIQAILEYNKVDRWNFDGLKYFLDEYLSVSDKSAFYDVILPKMIEMTLALPEVLSQSVPLLKRGTNQKITLSQSQICSLLANAFFCTFPNRNSRARRSQYSNYPSINFNGLFGLYNLSRKESQMEKLKCLINYFRRRIDGMAGQSLVTFSRRCLSYERMPMWEHSENVFTKLRIDVNGTIEDPENQGMLEVDFANAFVGGGVIGQGCVQEEIRFIICPELIVSRLFTERLNDNEVLIIHGFERYSDYTGYASNFKFQRDHRYTPLDKNQDRFPTTLVSMDALHFSSKEIQYSRENIDRELNKAYVGFFNEDEGAEPSCVATGNWGCGAFGGDPELKSVIQLMAAAENKRDLLYFTFGDEKLRDQIYETYSLLVDHSITVGTLYKILISYHGKSQSLFEHIRQCITYNTDTDEEETNDYDDKDDDSKKDANNDHGSNAAEEAQPNKKARQMGQQKMTDFFTKK